MRSISKVSIAYGLHNIPVKVCTVVRDSGTGMSNCCPDCNGDVGHKNYCKDCSRELETSSILKAYKVGDGKHVFSEAELNSLKNIEKSIEVVGSTSLTSILPTFVTGSYYLVPDTARKAYAILMSGMESTGRGIVVKFALRGKQKLGILTPEILDDKGVILLRTIAYGHQVQPMDEDTKYDLSDEEVKMGHSFIDSLKQIEYQSVEDSYANQLDEILSGKEIIAPVVKSKIDETAFFAV